MDEAGLESEPGVAVSGGKIDTGIRSAVEWKKPSIKKDEKQVVLNWQYDLSGVKSFRIYKAIDETPATMYKTITGDKREFIDPVVPGKQYKYRILAIFENGKKSELSKEISITY